MREERGGRRTERFLQCCVAVLDAAENTAVLREVFHVLLHVRTVRDAHGTILQATQVGNDFRAIGMAAVHCTSHGIGKHSHSFKIRRASL